MIDQIKLFLGEASDELIYLASPYSSKDQNPSAKANVEQYRFEQVCKAAAWLMRGGLFVFSPIAASHPLAVRHELPKDFAYWKRHNGLWLSLCSSLGVLMLPGYEESIGTQAEINMAESAGKPVFFLDPELVEK